MRIEKQKPLPTAASVLVTEDCNLRCTYCFENHNKNYMTKKVAIQAVNFLHDNAIKDKTNSFSVTFFGGEPLMNLDIVETMFEEGYRLSQISGIKFSTSIITNATIFNDRVKSILTKYRDICNLSVQLSVDGVKEIHDEYRLTISKKGSFELVERNIDSFKEIFKDNMSRLCIHGCLNAKTIGRLYESYCFFKHEWGFKNIWFLPVMEEKWETIHIKQYDEQNSYIYNEISKELESAKSIEPLYNYAPMDRCLMNGKANSPCGAGKNYITITANGDIYPCHQIYFNDQEKETLIGNIFTGINEPARTMFVDYDSSDLLCPTDCKNEQCYRCIAVNWIHNGNIFNTIKGNYCKLQSIDNKYQTALRKKAVSLGLINKESINNEDCLCNSRSSNILNECDIVSRHESSELGSNPNNPDCLCDVRSSFENLKENINSTQDFDFQETVSLALETILLKLISIEERLDLIERK